MINEAMYENELRYLVLDLKCRDTEYVSRLKQVIPSEQRPLCVPSATGEHEASRWADVALLFRGTAYGTVHGAGAISILWRFPDYEEDLRR